MDTRIHRFHGSVAIHFADSKTVYISPNDAQLIAAQLQICADDVMNKTFQQSTFKTFDLKLNEGE